MYFSPDQIKENGFQSATTQIKTEAYLVAVGTKERHTHQLEITKQFLLSRAALSGVQFGDDVSASTLVQLCLSYREATMGVGNFTRMNEPLLIVP